MELKQDKLKKKNLKKETVQRNIEVKTKVSNIHNI